MLSIFLCAASAFLRDALSAEWFVFEADQTGKQWWFPCAKEVLGARQATMDDLPDDEVQCASVSVQHFISSLKKYKPIIILETPTQCYNEEISHIYKLLS